MFNLFVSNENGHYMERRSNNGEFNAAADAAFQVLAGVPSVFSAVSLEMAETTAYLRASVDGVKYLWKFVRVVGV